MDNSQHSSEDVISESFLRTATYSAEGGHESTEDNNPDETEAVDGEPLREQDRFLPIANVARIMKKSIPANGKVAKDAKECVQECVSEFISFITSEASERCYLEKRKTINGEDILFAMSVLGFDNYVEPLKMYLQKYRESTKGEKVNNQVDSMIDDIPEDSFSALTGQVLNSEQYSQNNIIYTTYANQPSISFQ